MLPRAILLSAVLLGSTAFISRTSHTEPTPMRASFATFPHQIADWRSDQDSPLDDKVLAILGLSDYLNRVYAGQGRRYAGLYIGYWQSQRQGETIHSPLNCMPGGGWEPVSKRTLQITVDNDSTAKPIGVNRYVVQKGLDRQMVVYWYQSHGRVVASEYASKFYLVKDAISLNRSDAALVRVIVPIPSALEQAEASAEREAVRFVQSMLPLLTRYLPS